MIFKCSIKWNLKNNTGDEFYTATPFSCNVALMHFLQPTSFRPLCWQYESTDALSRLASKKIPFYLTRKFFDAVTISDPSTTWAKLVLGSSQKIDIKGPVKKFEKRLNDLPLWRKWLGRSSRLPRWRSDPHPLGPRHTQVGTRCTAFKKSMQL